MPVGVVTGRSRMGVFDAGGDRRRSSFGGKCGAYIVSNGDFLSVLAAVRRGDAALSKLVWDF